MYLLEDTSYQPPKQQVTYTTTGYGDGRRWHRGYGGGTATTTARTYNKGTLVVDIWRAGDKT